MSELSQLEAEYKQTQAALKDVSDQLKAHAERSAKSDKMSDDIKASVDGLLTKHTELQAAVRAMEQQLVRPSGNGSDEPESVGALVVGSQDFARMNSSVRGSMKVTVPRNAITTSTAGAAIQADRQAGIVAPGLRRMTVRDLIAPGSTSSNSVEYIRETGFTNAAAAVAETAAKPYSDIALALQTAPVRTIAHLFKISRQMLDDAQALRSYIDARAGYGLKLTEEAQLLFGSGAGANIYGIVPQATALNASLVPSGATAIDRIRTALLQSVLAEFPATGIVLNPADWMKIEVLKDTTGRYIIGNPQDGTVKRLWGQPVVETQAMTANNFLAGAFSMGAQIFDRLEVEVLLSTENADDFEKNMATIRAEERLALAVYRPESFITGLITPA